MAGYTNSSTHHHCDGAYKRIRDKATGESISPGNCREAWSPAVPKGLYCGKHETYCPVHTNWTFLRNQECNKCARST
jgi:hypothetical protein